MKKLTLFFAFCLTAIICNANTYRNDGDNYKFIKEAEKEKTFDVTSNSELEIEGDYSDYIISTWDKSQIAFRIVVTTKSNKEKEAIDKLNSISIEFSKVGNKVSAKTVFGNTMKSVFEGSLSIKYYVSVPADVHMDLETSYGDIFVSTVRKDFKAEIKYGNLIADSLLNDNEIDIKYGDIEVEYGKNLELEMKYGKAKIGNAEFVDAELKYSDMSARYIYRGIMKNEYTDVRLGKVNELSARNEYSDMSIAKLVHKLHLETQYSDITATLSGDSPDVNIKGQYSDVSLHLSDNVKFKYDFSTSYGDITADRIINKNHGKLDNARIVGQYGEDSAGEITISLSHGDLKIN